MVKDSGFTRDMGRMFGGRKSSWSSSAPSILPGLPNQPAFGNGARTFAPGSAQVVAEKVLGDDERGAVWPIFPASSFPREGEFLQTQAPLPLEEINTAVLFFDKFDIPSQNMMGGLEWCEGVFRKAGILRPSQLSVADGEMSSILKGLPATAFLTREELEPGRWTLARPAQALGLPAGLLTADSAIALTFQNALPTFTRDVDLDEVLEFKRRAWDELLALRAHLNELAREVAANGANDLVNNSVMRQFVNSLEAHITRMNESNRAKVWQAFKATFDLPTVVGTGMQIAYTGALDVTSLATGALNFSVKVVNGLRRKRDATNPFEYLTSAHLDL